MDAVEFVKEFCRMCQSYANRCEKCALYEKGCTVGSHKDDPEMLIKTVEAWSVTHPRKTRQDVFLEQWPDAQLDEDGVLKVCPALISAAYSNEDGGCVDLCRACVDCRREFWIEEVE